MIVVFGNHTSYAQWFVHPNGDVYSGFNGGIGSGSNLLLPRAKYHLFGTEQSDNVQFPSLRFQPANESEDLKNICPDYWEWWFNNLGKCEGTKKLHLKVGDDLQSTFTERRTFEAKQLFAGVLNDYPANTLDIGENTEIAFELGVGYNQGAIYIYNMNGLQLQKHDITKAGVGKLLIEGRSLKAGMYLYSLIVDGKEVDTKRMILTK